MYTRTLTVLGVLLAGLAPSFAQKTVDVATLSDSMFQKLDYKILNKFNSKDSVYIIVRVMDPAGNMVSNMAKPGKEKQYFTGLVDKAKKEICKGFTVTEAKEGKSPVPLYFSIVLDYSGSMDAHYTEMQNAADLLVSYLPEAHFTRVNFDHNIDVVEPVPTRRPKSARRDSYLKYGGDTALFGAVDAGVQSLRDAPGAHYVVVFTDGFENASGGLIGYASTEYELTLNARAANVPVYAVGFDLGGYPQLNSIASNTRGSYYDVQDIKDLDNTFKQMTASSFDRFYLIRAACEDTIVGLTIKQPGKNAPNKIVPIDQPDYVKPVGPVAVQFGIMKFDLSKAQLKPSDIKKLEPIADRIVNLLKDNPNATVEIAGHASPDGKDDVNELLAWERADAVFIEIRTIIKKKYAKDVDALKTLSRIKSEGYGSRYPRYSVTSYKNEENRRVEITLSE